MPIAQLIDIIQYFLVQIIHKTERCRNVKDQTNKYKYLYICTYECVCVEKATSHAHSASIKGRFDSLRDVADQVKEMYQ